MSLLFTALAVAQMTMPDIRSTQLSTRLEMMAIDPDIPDATAFAINNNCKYIRTRPHISKHHLISQREN